MPLYEYECLKCKRRFERIQKFSDPPIKTCPECKGSVRRLISSSALHFKGTGWYVTDYAKKDSRDGSKPAGETGEKASGDKPKTTEGKTEKSKDASKSKDSSPAKN